MCYYKSSIDSFPRIVTATFQCVIINTSTQSHSSRSLSSKRYKTVENILKFKLRALNTVYRLHLALLFVWISWSRTIYW